MIGVPSILKLIRNVESLVRLLPTFVCRWTENHQKNIPLLNMINFSCTHDNSPRQIKKSCTHDL